MSISRRGFLSALGLGGIALTLPKPLQLLQAVERPPIHVGRLLFPPLADGVTAFEMHNLSISPKQGISIAQFKDFFEKWSLKVSFHRNGEVHDMCHVPTPHVTYARGSGVPVPTILSDRILFTPDMRMDCWLRPDGDLKFPMPEVDMFLQGRVYRECCDKKPMPYWMYGKFQTVRVDLEQAKKLGLVPASEPEEDFGSERQEELAPLGNLLVGR